MSSSNAGSVSQWLDKLKTGKAGASQEIWGRYVERLVRLASTKLGASSRRMADEEDVAIVVFDAFLRGVEEGRFCKLDDRDDLWQVLVMLTERKATDQIRKETAQKRGNGEVRGESVFITNVGNSAAEGIAQYADKEPTPEFAVQAGQQLDRLLKLLNDEQLREIAVAKMYNYTNKEISDRVQLSVSSVERKLGRIRQIWEEADPQ